LVSSATVESYVIVEGAGPLANGILVSPMVSGATTELEASAPDTDPAATSAAAASAGGGNAPVAAGGGGGPAAQALATRAAFIAALGSQHLREARGDGRLANTALASNEEQSPLGERDPSHRQGLGGAEADASRRCGSTNLDVGDLGGRNCHSAAFTIGQPENGLTREGSLNFLHDLVAIHVLGQLYLELLDGLHNADPDVHVDRSS
jgi:hypothetical protein